MLVCASLGTACSALPAEPDVPALLSEPSAASRAELERMISAAFNGIPITLADDALTRESTLTIERNRPRDAEGRPLDGRDPGRPEHFRLFKAGSDCVLVQESTGRRWKLAASSCVAAPG